MKNVYFWSLIKHQFKVSKNWSGEIAFFHILIQKFIWFLEMSVLFFARMYLDIKFQNIALFSK